jgi:site-specific DNA-methyltransferase (adenine-specific)
MMPTWEAEGVQLYHGAAEDVLPSLPECHVDSVITDPPCGISFLRREWDSDKGGRGAWVAWLQGVLCQACRVAKPGASLLCWALPRTSHWTGWAVEDAGWGVRDCIYHLTGKGWPKPLKMTWALEQAGADGETAEAWSGWNNCLKPAAECWWLASKRLDGTFAENALRWGVAGLHIDGCRIPSDELQSGARRRRYEDGVFNDRTCGLVSEFYYDGSKGRYPANVLLDDEAAAVLDLQNPGASRYFTRFVYTAKATRQERGVGCEHLLWRHIKDGYEPVDAEAWERLPEDQRCRGNIHVSVKPLALMRWLCELTRTPSGGTVLDPFCGSGSTGVACVQTGRPFIGIEKDPVSFAIAKARIIAAMGGRLGTDAAATVPASAVRPRHRKRPCQQRLPLAE